MLGQFSLNVGMENEIVADGGMGRKNNDDFDDVYSYEDGMFSDIPMDKDWWQFTQIYFLGNILGVFSMYAKKFCWLRTR